MGKLSHRTGASARLSGQTDLQEGAEHIPFALALQRGVPHEPHHGCREHPTQPRPELPALGDPGEARGSWGFSVLEKPHVWLGGEGSEEQGQVVLASGPGSSPPHT